MSGIDVIDDGVKSAIWHMQKDSQQIASLHELKRPLLRFYEWQAPCITYGYFIDPKVHLKNDISGFEQARRPTGGGLLFHVNDLTFTVAIPKSHPKFSLNVLDNYRLINEAVLEATLAVKKDMRASLQIQHLKEPLREFCMASPTRYDLLLDGIKIGGSAQRKTKDGFVHQASIFLGCPPWEQIEECLHDGKAIVSAMKMASGSLCQEGAQASELAMLRRELSAALITGLQHALVQTGFAGSQSGKKSGVR